MPKLKDIPGCLIETAAEYDEGHTLVKNMAYNRAIEKQGEISITLNREKLAELLHERIYILGLTVMN